MKVAKRSKAWLLAINEQGSLEPRQRQVEKAFRAGEAVMDMNLGPLAKEKFRVPHVMGDRVVDAWLELHAEALYQGVGKARTEAFDIESIYALYPPSRRHFDFQHMVMRDSFDDVLDELAATRAGSRA